MGHDNTASRLIYFPCTLLRDYSTGPTVASTRVTVR